MIYTRQLAFSPFESSQKSSKFNLLRFLDYPALSKLLALLCLIIIYPSNILSKKYVEPAPTKDVYYYMSILEFRQADHKKQLEAARKLLYIADPVSIDILMYTVETHQNQDIRRYATQALGNIKSSETVEFLIGRMEYDKNFWVRLHATKALGEIMDGRTISPLIGQAKQEPNSFIRRHAIRALAAQGNKRAIPVLAYATKYDRHEIVRAYAARGLTDLVGEANVKSVLKTIKNKNVNHLRSKKPVIPLQNKGRKQIRIPKKTRRSYTKWEVFWRYQDVMDHGRSDTSSFGYWVDALLNSRNSYVQKKAALALRELQVQEGLPVLIEAFGIWTDKYVRRACMRAIKSFKDPKSLDLLIISVKEDKDPKVRSYAARGLKHLYTMILQLKNQYMAYLLQGENYSIEKQEMYLSKLRKYKTEAIEALIHTLQEDRSNRVKINCIITLRKLQYREAVPYLIYTAKDSRSNQVRYQAYRAILTLDRDATIPHKKLFLYNSKKYKAAERRKYYPSSDEEVSDSDDDNDDDDRNAKAKDTADAVSTIGTTLIILGISLAAAFV